jgi:Ca-activated chloride channel homolog
MNWFSWFWFSPNTFRQFKWANQEMLWLLILIPLLFFLKWVFVIQKKSYISLSINQIPNAGSRWVWLRFSIPLFFSLGLCTLILAMSRPQLPKPEKDAYGNGIDIALGIDVSESMLASDLKPDRLSVSKTLAIDFLKKRKQDRVALVAFAGEALTLCPLTTDYTELSQKLGSLNSEMISSSGTALGLALGTCINKVRDTEGDSKVVILISDGEDKGGKIGPEIAADLALTMGIRVYTIFIGNNAESNKLNPSLMKLIAQKSKGKFFRATDAKVLQNIFTEIDLLEKNRMEETGQKPMDDHYYAYLTWSLVFFLMALFLDKSLLGNIMED